MSKYGRGLNREIVGAINSGKLTEPICVQDVRTFTESKGWAVTNSYLGVCLANGASDTHSHTYRKYFVSQGDGLYVLAAEYRGDNWR